MHRNLQAQINRLMRLETGKWLFSITPLFSLITGWPFIAQLLHLVLNKFWSCIPASQACADTSECCSLPCSARAKHRHREGWQQDSSAVTETLINQGLVRPGRCSLACTKKPLSAAEVSSQGIGLGGLQRFLPTQTILGLCEINTDFS